MGIADLPWLIVAAEMRELSGIRRQAAGRWEFLANGPGPLAAQALGEKRNVDGIVSTGFCGALDPMLRIGDIVVSGQVTSPRPFVRGEILSVDRVAVTAVEKRALRERTGAAAVEMEAAAVEAKARGWGVPFRCVKVVSDVAAENLPLDFNLYRDAEGRFSRGRIALAAMARPFSVMPGLLRLDRNCRAAAERLGEFFADCTL
jgi:adenosylhomocysteine nucleosidase